MIAPHPGNFFTADFDLHGLAGVRAVSPHARDCELVAQALGPIRRPLNRTPDILITFVDRIETAGPLRLVGGHDCGFAGDQFFVVRGRNKASIRVQMPMQDLGGRCEIVCESGVKSVPLLIEIINLTALQRGALPLHASAFEFRGHGILCTGWAQGGKTETLLGFMSRGARYISDEWVYVREHGVCGIPEPMQVWDWHVDELPGFRRRIDWRDRMKMRCLRVAADSVEAVSSVRLLRRILPQRTTRRMVSLLNRQRYVELLPDSLFETPETDVGGRLDHVLFVMSHNSPEYRVEPVDVNYVIEAMSAALEQERSHLLEKLRMFRFAFPGCDNPRIREAGACERELLRKRLAHLPASIVLHPYPMSPTRLFETISPLFAVSKGDNS